MQQVKRVFKDLYSKMKIENVYLIFNRVFNFFPINKIKKKIDINK